MKKVSFVSGKGGTGKSTVVASLSLIVKDKIITDCDVDAPNLHILFNGNIIEEKDFYGMEEAFIDFEKCNKCGICRDTCRFEAITKDIYINAMKCEGCGACTLVCPNNAITLQKVKTGKTYKANTLRGKFAHALLDIGAEGSGKLVTEIRKNADDWASNEEWHLIDGSPGIGCVVIASITGADAVVVVSEPTQSGMSDLERIVGVIKHFGITGFVCINKFDLNLEITKDIENYCENNNIPVVGKIPFDKSIIEALQDYKTPIEADNAIFTKIITDLWENIKTNIED